jgi:V-type H+-transporting ATPase subunit a
MQYVQIVCPQTLLEECVELLGENGVFQFVDRNRAYTTVQRGALHTRFAHAIKEIKRCDEMERILRALNNATRKVNVAVPGEATGAANPLGIQRFAKRGDKENSFDAVLKNLSSLESKANQQLSLITETTKLLNGCVELEEVLKQAKARYMEGNFNAEANSDESSLLHNMDFGDTDVRIVMIGGVVNQANENGLRRQIFRASRGNAIVYLSPIDGRPMYDPVTQEEVQLSVVLVFFQRSPELQQKIERTCSAFAARMQNLPDIRDKAAVDMMLAQTREDFQNQAKLKLGHQSTLKKLLGKVVGNLERWTIAARSRKSVFHNITKFERQGDDRSHNLLAYGWVLKSEADRMSIALGRTGGGGQMAPILISLNERDWPESPPTYFETNKFTSVFQGIVDTYGTPRYQEANPALFEVIMFPFLFGVMYGDIGHGLIMLIAAVYLVKNEEALSKPGALPELLQMVFGGRYLIVMMGAFSVYMGFLYNDLFSMNLPIFGTTWRDAPKHKGANHSSAEYLLPESTYPFGMDPAWRTAENQLLFANSMKMKMSVILGITQMMFGLLLRFSNAIHFRNKLDLFFECIPMFTFATCLFGYMMFMIVYKWTIDWTGPQGMGGGYGPPSIIVNLINMVLKPGTVKDAMYGQYQSPYDLKWKPGMPAKENICTTTTSPPCGQAVMQVRLLILAGLCIPLILLPKPLILHYCKDKKRGHRGGSGSEDGVAMPTLGDDDGAPDAEHGAGGPHGDEGHHGFGDIMIHQIIETIEFVLGMVSNTASYLRLWALSLAHGQLAEVFWEKAFLSTVNMEGPLSFIYIVIGFQVWAAATIGVLCLMDPLECFLHALRLHWVEFQSKFFKADGYPFEPFDLKTIDGKLVSD